jgi:hypothetical protein
VGIGFAVLLVNLIVFMGRTFLKNNPIPRLFMGMIVTRLAWMAHRLVVIKATVVYTL